MNQGYDPIISSITLISPSQLLPDPIPMVGIFREFVILDANFSSTLSRTRAEMPTFSRRIDSLNIAGRIN